ncbi:Tyrosine recombinase XerD [compost metagenome]
MITICFEKLGSENEVLVISFFVKKTLGSGTDLRFIQKLLGHANPATTERYTHVSTKNLKRIQSPLDASTSIWTNQSQRLR